MKSLVLFLLLFSSLANAQETSESSNTPTILEMSGTHFCRQYDQAHSRICEENLGKTSIVNLSLSPTFTTSQRKWTLRIYFGNANTFYDPTIMTIKTSGINATLSDIQGKQRSGYEYFKVWNYPLKDSMRWLDEPTNNLKIVFDRHNHQFYLLINHPKVVYINAGSDPTLNNEGNVHVTGTVNGVYHDENMPMNLNFAPPDKPGELTITKFENAWMWMQIETGYGYAIPLIRTRRLGSVVFTPQLQAGIYLGYKNSAKIVEEPQPVLEDYSDQKTRIMGFSVTPAARLEWRGQKDRFGIFGEARRSFGYMNYPFLDGTIEHNIRYSSITLGISTTLPNTFFHFKKTKKRR